MSNSDERREVAARLRNDGRALDAIDAPLELASLTLDDALGIDHMRSWCDVFERLADLIDPTCEVKDDNRWTSDFAYVCCACGEHFSTCNKPNYCPNCGARVVERGEADG
jgi:DNA-directed RNA polymerase subunit RPC12/RpoP